jgi:ribonuclease J
MGGIVEQRVMLNLINPKYVVPVHGDLSQRLTLKREAVKMGWDPKNVLIIEDGSLVEIDEKHELVFSRKKIPLEALGVDGMSIGSLETRAIKERIQLGEEGVSCGQYKRCNRRISRAFLPRWNHGFSCSYQRLPQKKH